MNFKKTSAIPKQITKKCSQKESKEPCGKSGKVLEKLQKERWQGKPVIEFGFLLSVEHVSIETLEQIFGKSLAEEIDKARSSSPKKCYVTGVDKLGKAVTIRFSNDEQGGL